MNFKLFEKTIFHKPIMLLLLRPVVADFDDLRCPSQTLMCPFVCSLPSLTAEQDGWMKTSKTSHMQKQSMPQQINHCDFSCIARDWLADASLAILS